MFSYRHAFHAGNHADVLKHTALIACLKHLAGQEKALLVLDTHAGAGLYRLDGDAARTSAEADHGIFSLLSTEKIAKSPKSHEKSSPQAAPENGANSGALGDYLELVRSFNPGMRDGGKLRIYPGSPFIIQRYLQGRDRLKAFEWHPTDTRTLSKNIAQLDAGRQVAVLHEDGFGSAKKYLPPPSRRALVVCDPSYEMKADYARVADYAQEALQRFATGVYFIWYPIIPRPEAHELPRRLTTIARRAGKPFLQATLTVKSSKITKSETGEVLRPGLPASGVFVINPPHTLKPALAQALPALKDLLGQGSNAAFSLE
jgi:23S rRNA (adenine2030-N6)-methyltransferase